MIYLHVESKKVKIKKIKLVDAENRLEVSGGKDGQMHEGGKGTAQASSYKISTPRGCNVQHGDTVNNTTL